jgi:hypothetical protein
MDAVDLRESARVLIAGLSAKRDAFARIVTELEAFLAAHDVSGLTTLPPSHDTAVLLDGHAVGRAMVRPSAPVRQPRPRREPPAPRAETPAAPNETEAAPSDADAPTDETDAEPQGRAKPGAHDRKVLITLRDAPFGLPLSDISRAVFGRERGTTSVGTMKGVLDRLVRDGHLVREGRIYKRVDCEDGHV